MPTYIGQTYSKLWRGRPPHMLAPDIPVWYRFLEKYGDPIVNLYYDCLLGGPYIKDEEQADPMLRMWRANTSKRADAIAELEQEVWIIEVADYPGLRAAGQLITYQTLWLEDQKIDKVERLLLVCENIDNDLGASLGRWGVQIYIV